MQVARMDSVKTAIAENGTSENGVSMRAYHRLKQVCTQPGPPLFAS